MTRFNIIQNSSRSSPELNFLNTWLQVHIQIIFMKKILFFQTSCSNWKYCKLGAKNFFSNLLMFFQQHIITGSDIWNSYFSDSLFFTWVMIKWRSATAAISANLFFVLAMTPNCANPIHNIKTRTRLWRDPLLRTFAIHQR